MNAENINESAVVQEAVNTDDTSVVQEAVNIYDDGVAQETKTEKNITKVLRQYRTINISQLWLIFSTAVSKSLNIGFDYDCKFFL